MGHAYLLKQLSEADTYPLLAVSTQRCSQVALCAGPLVCRCHPALVVVVGVLWCIGAEGGTCHCFQKPRGARMCAEGQVPDPAPQQ